MATSTQRADKAYQAVANSLMSRMWDNDTYGRAVGNFLLNADRGRFSAQFLELWGRQRFRGVFNASASTIEEFSSKPIFRRGMPAPRLAATYVALLEASRTRVSAFFELRRQFERSFLTGEFEACRQALDASLEQCGESLWWIRSTMILLGRTGRLEEMAGFAESCKARASDKFVVTLVNWLFLVTTDPRLHLPKMVGASIRELFEAKVTDWAALLSLMFMPRPLLSSRDTVACFFVIQSYSIVDQAWMLQKYVTEATATHGGSSDLDDLASTLRSLGAGLPEQQAAVDSLTLEFTKAYEHDEFDRMQSMLQDSFCDGISAGGTLNLMARGVARRVTTSPLQGGAYESLIDVLADGYLLKSPAAVEEDFIAELVDMQWFSDSYQLQLAIYKAMPNRFPRDDQKWLARAATLTTGATPLTRALAEGRDPQIEFDYVSDPAQLPEHRRIKHGFRQALRAGEFAESLRLLREYEQSAPLKKDVIELAVAYYRAAADLPGLVRFAAATLAKEPEAYAALPMSDIADYIEGERPSSVEAVLSAYFFAKKIDVSREYLLNELYEEFLLSIDVERPTELLDRADAHDPIWIAFFRDVSTLETMDYLGSFENSNDLRSERIRLLDWLWDQRAITSEVHRAEVDEIIGQVIVDTGATEFNVAKIDVNVAALKRKMQSDVAALMAAYRSADVRQEDKVFRIGSEVLGEDADTLLAVVAGDKNTTLLRMLVQIRRAYLYDEKFGLDQNLSTEVRHGFFPNLIRSRPEEQKLITEADETGKFKSNTYWINSNSIIAPEILSQVDEQLKWFSAKFNELVQGALEWMKVTADEASSSRVFTYGLGLTELNEARAAADLMPADEFLEYVFAKLERRTDECLLEMREKLNVAFKRDIDQLFDELLERINAAKQGVRMVELVDSIVQVKNEIREDVTTIADWFKRSEARVGRAHTIPELIDISLECYFRIRGLHASAASFISEDLRYVTLTGRQVKVFIVVLVNLLENAYRRSGLGPTTSVRFEGHRVGESWTLRLRNSLSEDRARACTSQFATALLARIRSDSSMELLTKEGGSGLSKVFHKLKMLSDRFDIGISVAQQEFEVAITYA